MIDQLKSIGIAKGKPFAPDAAIKDALTAGMNEAHAWLMTKYDAAPPTFSRMRIGHFRHIPIWSKRRPGISRT